MDRFSLRDKDYVLACVAACVSIIDSLEPLGIVFFGAYVLKNFARKICLNSAKLGVGESRLRRIERLDPNDEAPEDLTSF
jgi:hypothetical protein